MFTAHYLLSDEKLNPIKLVGAVIAIAGATTLLLSNASGLATSTQQSLPYAGRWLYFGLFFI
jgi:hypothetical protein